MTQSNSVPFHCSVCNRLFEVEHNAIATTCPNCHSVYIHVADATCKGVSFNEWKNNENYASIAESIPDSTGDSTDGDFIEAIGEIDIHDQSTWTRTLG